MPGTPEVVFVLGGPGSGKGTQCAKLVKEFDFVHLSAGELLREERDRDSDDAKLINTYMKEGKIVPVEVTINLIKQAMEKAGWASRKYLIDGFPRNENNYKGFFSVMGSHVAVKKALHFEASEEILTERIMERAKTSGRVDDNLESLKLRFKTYREQQLPILSAFKEAGTLTNIECSRTIDEIFADVKTSLQLN
jgi:UMP-CMP kinase